MTKVGIFTLQESLINVGQEEAVKSDINNEISMIPTLHRLHRVECREI